MMMKNILLFTFIFCVNLAFCQKTIPFPSDSLWSEYVDDRMLEVQKSLYDLIDSEKVNIYKTDLLDKMDTSIFSATYTKEEFNHFILDHQYRSGELVRSNVVDSLFSGLCFSIDNEMDNILGIGFMHRAWLAGGIRDAHSYPACWLDFSNVMITMSESDLEFIYSVYEIAKFTNYNYLKSQPSPREAEQNIFRLINGYPKFVVLDSSFNQILYSFPRALVQSIKSEELKVYDFQQEKEIDFKMNFEVNYHKYESIMVLAAYDDTLDIVDCPKYKTVKIPSSSANYCYPVQAKFNLNNQLTGIFLRLDTNNIETINGLNKGLDYYSFAIKEKQLKALTSFLKLSFWLEDYYQWYLRKKNN